MSYLNETRLVQQLQKEIETKLSQLGLLFRVFSRAKSENSLMKKYKQLEGKYSSDGKKIQDLFGIRIVLYFADDLNIAQTLLQKYYSLDSKSVDEITLNKFEALRCNYVFYLPESISADSELLKKYDFVDNTFEVQFRTIISEGWHEVEHDLRYKCKSDWETHTDLSRALNGIYASLETSDWGIMKLFEDLAFRHYKAQQWSAMLRTKLRLRAEDDLKDDIIKVITDNNLGKQFYQINRNKLLANILKYEFNLPITLNNLIFICNHFFIESIPINNITPDLVNMKISEAVERFENKNRKLKE